MYSKPDLNCSISKKLESKRKPQISQTQRHRMALAANGTKEY